jgi:hypothetical protein
MFGPPFLVVHNQLHYLTDVEGEVVVSDLLPIGDLIVVGDQASHRCVVTKLNYGVGVMHSRSRGRAGSTGGQ